MVDIIKKDQISMVHETASIDHLIPRNVNLALYYIKQL
jgi:hypothetical protein